MTYAIYQHSPPAAPFRLVYICTAEADSPAEALALAKEDGISAPIVSLVEGVIQ